MTILRVSFCFILLLPLIGCEHRAEPTLTFAVGGAPAEIAFWEKVASGFEETHATPVTILRQPSDSDQRRQGLVIPLQARQADPDVFLMDVAWVAQFAASNWLEPIVSTGGESVAEEGVFFPRVLDLVDRHEGRLIALPIYVDAGLLYYRRDLLARHGYSEPPKNWEELVEMARRIQQAERVSDPAFHGFVWQGAQYEGLLCTFLEFAASRGGGIKLQGGEIAVATTPNIAAAQFMQDLIHKYRISPLATYTEMREEEVRALFQAGHAVFERNWPYAWALHQAEGSPVRGLVGVTALPSGTSGRRVGTLGGWHIGISRSSDSKLQAAALINYLTSAAVQKQLALELGWNPGRMDLYHDHELLERMPHLTALRVAVEHSEARPVIPYYTRVSEVIRRHLNAVLANQSSPSAALERAAEEVRRLVSRYADATP